MRKAARTTGSLCPSWLAHRARSRAPPAASSCAAWFQSSAETVSPRTPGAPGCSVLAAHQLRGVILAAANQARGGAIPLGEIRRNVEAEREHEAKVQEHREQRRWMRQAPGCRLSKDHRLDSAEDRSEGETERHEQNRR